MDSASSASVTGSSLLADAAKAEGMAKATSATAAMAARKGVFFMGEPNGISATGRQGAFVER